VGAPGKQCSSQTCGSSTTRLHHNSSRLSAPACNKHSRRPARHCGPPRPRRAWTAADVSLTTAVARPSPFETFRKPGYCHTSTAWAMLSPPPGPPEAQVRGLEWALEQELHLLSCREYCGVSAANMPQRATGRHSAPKARRRTRQQITILSKNRQKMTDLSLDVTDLRHMGPYEAKHGKPNR
jgi:hypothetical protein